MSLGTAGSETHEVLSLSGRVTSTHEDRSLSRAGSGLIGSPLLTSGIRGRPSVRFAISARDVSSNRSPLLPGRSEW